MKARVGTDAFVNEERRIRDQWQQLTAPEKELYKAESHTAEDAQRQLRAGGLRYQDVEQHSGGEVAAGTAQRMKREIYDSVVSSIDNDPVWKRGLQIMSSCSALSASNVSMEAKDWHSRVRDIFGYNEDVLVNPAGTMQPRRTCVARCWGCCQRDVDVKQFQCLTYNCWFALKQWWGMSRSKFPLKVRLAWAHGHEDYVLADYVGSGETLLLIRLIEAEGPSIDPDTSLH